MRTVRKFCSLACYTTIQGARQWLMSDRRAVTAVEYAIIAGIIVTALVVSMPAIAPELSNIFSTVSQKL